MHITFGLALTTSPVTGYRDGCGDFPLALARQRDAAANEATSDAWDLHLQEMRRQKAPRTFTRVGASGTRGEIDDVSMLCSERYQECLLAAS